MPARRPIRRATETSVTQTPQCFDAEGLCWSLDTISRLRRGSILADPSIAVKHSGRRSLVAFVTKQGSMVGHDASPSHWQHLDGNMARSRVLFQMVKKLSRPSLSGSENGLSETAVVWTPRQRERLAPRSAITPLNPFSRDSHRLEHSDGRLHISNTYLLAECFVDQSSSTRSDPPLGGAF